MRVNKRSRGRFTIEKDLNESFRIRITESRIDLEATSKVWKTTFLGGTMHYAFISHLMVEEEYESILTIARTLFTFAEMIMRIPESYPKMAKLIEETYAEHIEKDLAKPIDTDESDDDILAKEQALHASIQEEAATREGKKAVKKMTKDLEKPRPAPSPKKAASTKKKVVDTLGKVAPIEPKVASSEPKVASSEPKVATPKKVIKGTTTKTSPKKKAVKGTTTKTTQKKDAKTKSN